MDSLGALNAFVRAAEARSFTAAGRQLSLSPSAIGKAVARLEERLGVRLFHRSTRSIALTEEGKLFLETCRRIFSEVETIEREFARTAGAPKGKLRMSLPLVGMLLMPTLAAFMSAYPEIELDMDFTDEVVDVIDRGYDVAVRTGEAKDSRLMSRTLGTYQFAIVGSPAYFARAGEPSSPEQLAKHACLHHKYPSTGKLQPWPFVRSATTDDVVLPTAATASAVEPLVALATLGLGIACVPDFAIQRQIAEGSLVSVLGDHIEQRKAVRAVWPSSRYLSPKVRVFLDFLAEHLFAARPADIASPPRAAERGPRRATRPAGI
jgi:DNA-binding transcriptional LysR family regulator